MADEKKSVTIRLDEPDLVEWAASQSAAVASIRMAVKICILQYGKDVDLLDAILRAQFGNGENSVRPMSDKNQNTSIPKKPISEQIESDNNQNNVGQDVHSYPQSNPQMNGQGQNQQMVNPNQGNQMMGNQQMMNPQMNPQMGNQMNQPNNQPMMNPQMGNQMGGNPNQTPGMSSSLSSLL